MNAAEKWAHSLKSVRAEKPPDFSHKLPAGCDATWVNALVMDDGKLRLTSGNASFVIDCKSGMALSIWLDNVCRERER